MSELGWDAWRREVFGDPYLVWHDGPDFAKLIEIPPEQTARMLAAGLAEGDSLAAQSYGELGTHGLAPADAVELMRARVPDAAPAFLTDLAEALFTLTGDPSWWEPIARVLHTAESPYTRLDAARALRPFPVTGDLVAAVLAGVRDPDYLVRYHSCQTLMHYAGKDGDLRGALLDRIAGDEPAGWAAAGERLANDI